MYFRFIGGLYGRIIGRVLVDMHGGIPNDSFWEWIDPGALALIGAASFFGGVTRLTMSLTVIMVSYSVFCWFFFLVILFANTIICRIDASELLEEIVAY